MRGVSAGLRNWPDKEDRYRPERSRCLICSREAVKSLLSTPVVSL